MEKVEAMDMAMDETMVDYEEECDRLYRQLATERRRRRDAERMCAVYGSMATWGGVVMLTLTVLMYYVIK